MKRIVLTMMITMLLLMTCGSLNAFALTDGDWEFQLLDNEVMITGYLGEGGDVVIPKTIYGATVTKIKDDNLDFFRSSKPKSIRIPGTIKKIGFGACFGWEELEELVYEEGIEHIYGSIIQKFKNLHTVVLPSSLRIIDDYSFLETSSLKQINIPSGVEKIGSDAFACSGLEKIDLSQMNSVTLGYQSFGDCDNLREVILPDNLKVVPQGCFSDCDNLNKVQIPATVTKIEGFAFESTPLSQMILPCGLKEISNGAFAETNLNELVIPYGTEKVGRIFWPSMGLGDDCITIKSIYLPDTVKTMDNVADSCPNAIVYCSSGSYAEKYCKKNQISYLTDNSVNSGITVLYNGTRISFHAYGQNPELLNSRTLVPLRSIFEAMGAEVEWDSATSTAIAKRNGIEIKIQIGANEMYKDGKAISVDVPARLLNDRTMVPVRVLAEAFGADVQWNENGRTVLITE
ncbi:MAG: leucine-rich repeat protein [Clostridia bacterium]|nr:leucine-rich repeat protein [Clostridia bacterium]